MRPRWIIVFLALMGCSSTPPVSGSTPPASTDPATQLVADAAPTPRELDELEASIAESPGDVADAHLRALLAEHWSWTLEHNPLEATALGIHAYDHRVAERGPEATAKRRAAVDGFLERAHALDRTAMSPDDSTTLDLFIEGLTSSKGTAACRFEQWSLSARNNPVTAWSYLPEAHPFRNEVDAARYLLRVEQIAPAIRGEIDNLRLGLGDGLVANAESTRRVLEMLDRQLETSVDEWPLAGPIAELEAGHKPEQFDARLRELLETKVRPALVNYRDFVRDELMPKARGDEAPALDGLDIGDACYAALIRKYTTLPKSADEVHEVGLAEIERINGEMRRLGKKLFETKNLPEILERLRTDEALFFDSAEQVQEAAEQTLAEAKAAMPEYFGRLPKADCLVTPIPDYEAPYTTIAYYRQPHADGSKPGEYFINLYEPKTRPRYEARVLAVHESIPGHHLQIAIAQEVEGLPAFRKHGGMTVFVEGWGLYTERLAEQMGLYRDDLDRMGMLSFDAWRASRLVVDTGLHAKGWSREQAKTFMLEHTALAPNNIDNEVDRYITTPGQALAYKTGQMELWRLRTMAEATLEDDFDLRGFHDAVLGGGAVTLAVLEQRVEAWVRSVAAKGESDADGRRPE